LAVKVKVCGITNLEDAMTAVQAGGAARVERTPRFVTPERVAPIVRALPPFVTPVGVFWDHPTGHVKAVAEACGLRALQFHGDETPDDLAAFALPVIKTIKLPPATAPGEVPPPEPVEARIFRYARCAAILLDSATRWSEGEARQPIEWQVARRCAASARIVLSGGLTPENVGRAVATARPYAVDVNSGVEAGPGRKDGDRVRRFVAEAKAIR
jgi:phosphoribosylanthranilate isomerase